MQKTAYSENGQKTGFLRVLLKELLSLGAAAPLAGAV
jgi:hypothetical protein